MALTTRCLDCRALTKGSRCARCTRGRDEWTTRRKIRTGWDWGKLRAQVHARDRACVRCGSADAHLEVHHVVPLGGGGSNRLENLELVCRPCHSRAHRREARKRQDARRSNESGAGTSTPIIA